LFAAEHVFGLLEVRRSVGRSPFTESDLQLGQHLAAQAGVALENARLHTAVQENLRELDALLKASEALLSTLELDPLLQNILAAAVTAIPSAEKGTVCLADAERRVLQVRAVHGYRDPGVRGLTFGLDQGYSGQALRENRPLLVADTAEAAGTVWSEALPETRTLRSAIVAPLAPKGAAGPPHGVISLDALQPNAFTPADLRRLVAFANTAAVAIDNAQLHAEVQRLAVTDGLTGLANPRAFENALATEFHRAGRYGYSLSLIIMDIDSFKQYNDTYGHLAGNERLKAIAGVLRANVRDPDLPVRYGGEEFALLLPHTNKAGALALAERVRVAAEVAAPKRDRRGGPISGYSLSLGVASFPNDALTAEQLLLAADNAELAAKRGGKNRVIAAAALPEAVRAG
jgi:diguanylate cyclase (GGDEF)-like protein